MELQTKYCNSFSDDEKLKQEQLNILVDFLIQIPMWNGAFAEVLNLHVWIALSSS